MDVVSPGGRIVTFYSFKGGAGRTLTLANVAWILASNGLRVLAIDWDLEAPGLHRYFRPFLDSSAGATTAGLIDLFEEFSLQAAADRSRPVVSAFATDVLPYVQAVNWEFPKPGFIDVLPAGRYDPSYPTRVNTFAWQTFYRDLGGASFLDRLRDALRTEYDYILIDSRTGISDVNGICTVQMPDALVACFTLNPTSLSGCATVAQAVRTERRDRPIEILPVPMRLEIGERDLLEQGLAHARQLFQPLMPDWPEEEQRRYWQEVAFFNSPYYAFNEVLSAFGDQHRDSGSLIASAERLTSYVTRGEVRAIPPIDDSIPFHSIPFHSIPFHSIPFHSHTHTHTHTHEEARQSVMSRYAGPAGGVV